MVFNRNSNGLYNNEQKSIQFCVAILFYYMIHNYVLREWSNKLLYYFYVFDKYKSNTFKYFRWNYILLELAMSNWAKNTPSFKTYPYLSTPYYVTSKSMFCSIISPNDYKNYYFIFLSITLWSTPNMWVISEAVGIKWVYYNLAY